jgi:hypothetical protein
MRMVANARLALVLMATCPLLWPRNNSAAILYYALPPALHCRLAAGESLNPFCVMAICKQLHSGNVYMGCNGMKHYRNVNNASLRHGRKRAKCRGSLWLNVLL